MQPAPIWIALGSLRFDRSVGQDLISELARAQAVIRSEPGCKDYRFSVDVENDAIVNVTELWDSPACFDDHVNNAHSNRFVGSLKEMGLMELVMSNFTATQATTR